jgi:hypothetical protein
MINKGKKPVYNSMKEADPYGGNHKISDQTDSPLINTLKKLLFLFVSALLTIFFSISLNKIVGHTEAINKEKIQESLTTIIESGGDLRAIKRAYSTYPKSTEYFFNEFESYPSSVSLTSILEDIRVKSYLDKKQSRIEKIDSILSLYEQTNPFDKLAQNQKSYFENIRIKSADKYIDIAPDLNDIVNELHEKNQAVDEYLSDSTTAFWISLLGLIFSIAIGVYQIYIGRSSKMITAPANI